MEGPRRVLWSRLTVPLLLALLAGCHLQAGEPWSFQLTREFVEAGHHVPHESAEPMHPGNTGDLIYAMLLCAPIVVDLLILPVTAVHDYLIL
jgi:hypothetical protein